MGKNQRKPAQKVTAVTKRYPQKKIDTAELIQCELEYSKIFQVLNKNQAHSQTEGFQAQAEKGIAIAIRMVELNRQINAQGTAEQKRLNAVYLTKQANLLMLMGRRDEAVLLLKQSFDSSSDIIISYEVYNGFVQSGYFNEQNLHENADFLIELYKRGSSNVTRVQKNMILDRFKILQNDPKYQGEYKDVLNSFFFSAIQFYTEQGLMDRVIESFNGHKEQIGTIDYSEYINDLNANNKTAELIQLLSNLTLTSAQYDIHFNYIFATLNKYSDQNLVDLLTHFSQCGHLLSMAFLTWVLIKSNNEQGATYRAMDLAHKALLKSKSIKDTTERNKVASCVYHTIARIYDFGLLDDVPGYQQSDEKAFHYYKLAVDAGNVLALQDMAIMYRDGQGVPQDLDKAHELLEQSIKAGNTEAIIQVPGLFVGRASTDPVNRNQLIDEGIIKAIDGMIQLKNSGKENLFSNRGNFYYNLAMLYLMRDSKISLHINNGKILGIFCLADLLNKDNFEHHNTENQQHIARFLTESMSGGQTNYADFFAVGHLTGNYLEKDLSKAEYWIEKTPWGLNRCLLSVLLELERSNDLEAGPDRDDHLEAAFNYYNIIENMFTIIGEVNKLLPIRELIDGFKQDKARARVNSLISLFQRSPIVSSGSTDRKSELTSLIDNLLLTLASSELPITKEVLFDSVKTIHVLVSKIRMSVPSYTELLPKLLMLQTALRDVANELSSRDIYTLIGYFQRWPVQNQQAIEALGFTVRIHELDKQKDIAHALLDISHGSHIDSINNLRLLLLSKLDISEINDPHLLSQLLYCCATQVAVGYTGSVAFKYKAPLILKLLNKSLDELYDTDKSQIYIAIQYLKLIDASLINDLSSLQSLLIDQEKVMSQADQVSVSRQQEEVYQAIKIRFPSTVNEPVIAGRRPDYFIPEKNLVIFYHGPGHYHFDAKGHIIDTNLSTKLAEQTLRKAGYTVEVISFEEYQSAKNLDLFVKNKLAAYLPQRVVLSENQNAWFNRPTNQTPFPGQGFPPADALGSVP